LYLIYLPVVVALMVPEALELAMGVVGTGAKSPAGRGALLVTLTFVVGVGAMAGVAV
jgi:hypothetical protein